MNIQSTRFGNSYPYRNMAKAQAKQAELKKQNIHSEIESRSRGQVLTVMEYVVHTDENGTKDLTNFRSKKQP